LAQVIHKPQELDHQGSWQLPMEKRQQPMRRPNCLQDADTDNYALASLAR
jgi:hypothetical protein